MCVCVCVCVCVLDFLTISYVSRKECIHFKSIFFVLIFEEYFEFLLISSVIMFMTLVCCLSMCLSISLNIFPFCCLYFQWQFNKYRRKKKK